MRRELFLLALGGALAGCDRPCDEPGTVCTLVGAGYAAFDGDGGNARDALLYYPTDLAWRPGTDEYVIVDWNNERLRRVDGDGVIDTVVGRNVPGDGNENQLDRTDPGLIGTEVSMNHPTQAEFGPDGHMYISAWHNHKVRRWDPETGLVRVVVANHDNTTGNNGGYAGDGGDAEAAHLWFPSSIAFDEAGQMYIVDEKNLVVRRVGPDNVIDTFAGCGDYIDLDGELLVAGFRFPNSPTTPQPLPGGAIEIDGDFAYVADTFGHTLRRIDLVAGTVWTIPVDPPLNRPSDVEMGPDGRLYVAETDANVVRAVHPVTGESEIVAGTGEEADGADGVPATESALFKPFGLDFADDGALLIADTYNSKIRRVTP